MRRLLRRDWPVLAFGLAVLAIYWFSPVLQNADGRLVVYEANSVIEQGNLDLHEYGAAVTGFPCYVEGERRLSRYPYGTALLTVPFLAVAKAGGAIVGDDATDEITTTVPRQLEQDLAAVLATLAVLALVLLGRELTGRLAPALLLGAVYALGTSLWSTLSRGLWQHGPLILLVALGLLCLVRGRDRADHRWSALAGVPLGMAYVVRPTAAIVIGLAAIALFVGQRRALPWYLGAIALVVGPSVAYILAIYGQPTIPFYTGFLEGGIHGWLPEGLAGTLLTPARGLLVYSPFVALAGAGIWLARRRGGPTSVEWVCIGAALATWITASNTYDWVGGYSYGPRLLADALPYLAVLLVPVLDAVTRPVTVWRTSTAGLAVALAVTVSWSVFVHARGALAWPTQQWNVTPQTKGIEKGTDAYWDWTDPAFLRSGDVGMRDLMPSDAAPQAPADQICR